VSTLADSVRQAARDAWLQPTTFRYSSFASPIQGDLAGTINFNFLTRNLNQRAATDFSWPDTGNVQVPSNLTVNFGQASQSSGPSFVGTIQDYFNPPNWIRSMPTTMARGAQGGARQVSVAFRVRGRSRAGECRAC